MHTTTDIYNYLNTTFRDNLSETKIRNLGYILGKTGTFVIANLGEYCEANDECSTNYCGDDGWYCWETCTTQCTTGGIGAVCNNANQCSTGICGLGHCSDGAIGRECENGSQCTSGYCGDTGWNYGSPTCTDGSAGQYCGSADSCAPGNYCNYNDYTCTATDGNIGSGCGDVSDCDAGLYCSQQTYTCIDGSVGSPCSVGNECSSGYCNTDFSECTTGVLGDGCGANGDCISAYCGYDGVQSFCTDGSIGSDCNQNIACVSGYCDAVNYQCSDGSVGAGCTNNNQCSSNLCSSVTSQCISGEIGTSCTVAQECDSTFCDTFNGICKADGSIGSACGLHSECESEFCSSNVCTAPTLTSRLSAYWNFNETSGTAFADASGNGKVGVLVSGTLVNQAGKLGTAFKFDGTNDRATVANIDIANSSFTFSIWIANTSTGNSPMFGHGTSGSNKYLHITRSNTYGGKALFAFFGNDLAANSVISSSGTWEHWVFVYKLGVGKKIYKNGVLDATGGGGAYQAPAGTLVFGSIFGNQFFKGTMDEIGLWNRALTADEVTQLYNGGAGLGYSSF